MSIAYQRVVFETTMVILIVIVASLITQAVDPFMLTVLSEGMYNAYEVIVCIVLFAVGWNLDTLGRRMVSR